MIEKWKHWWSRRKKLLLRLGILMLAAVLIGCGICVYRQPSFVPDLNAKGYKILVNGTDTYCTLGRKTDNLLLRLSPKGELLGVWRSGRDVFAEEFRYHDGYLYAIVTDRGTPKTGLRQYLMRFEADRKNLKPEMITQLDTENKTRWKSLDIESTGRILLAGFSDGKICTAEYGGTEFEDNLGHVWPTLKDGTVNRILRGSYGTVAWINMDASKGDEPYGQVNLCAGDQVFLDVGAPSIKSPNRMNTYEGELFVSDSVSGNIYRIFANREPELFRTKKETPMHSESGRELNLANFSVYRIADRQLGFAGIWSDGSETKLVTDGWTIDHITAGAHVPLLYWQQFWPAALAAFVVLAVLAAVIERIFHARRLASRLLLCEVSVALVLVLVMTGMQVRSYTEIADKAPKQQRELMAATMSMGLTADAPMSSQMLREKTEAIWAELMRAIPEKDQKNYQIRIIWKTDTGDYAIGYDAYHPRGYLVEDVEDQDYRNRVKAAITGHQRGLSHSIAEENRTINYCMYYLSQGSREGCVVVRQTQNLKMMALDQLSEQLMLTLVIAPILFALLLLLSRWLLAPLDRIQKALEEFHTGGSGNQMNLRGIPHTELYEIGRVFNQLSRDTRVQMNELDTVSRVYARMVPPGMLRLLGMRSVETLKAGSTVEIQGNVLILALSDPKADASMDRNTLNRIVDAVGIRGGFAVDYNERLGALTALFPTWEQALDCGYDCLTKGYPVLPTALQEPMTFGVFGGDNLLYPAALTTRMTRRMAAIARLRELDARMLRCTSDGEDMRLLGWDGTLEFYEEGGWHGSEWLARWREADPVWRQAMELYRRGEIKLAARMFASVLRILPEDAAAQWYLMRCKLEQLQPDRRVDGGLLDGWEELQ